MGRRWRTQGRSYRSTLGWRTQSRWDWRGEAGKDDGRSPVATGMVTIPDYDRDGRSPPHSAFRLSTLNSRLSTLHASDGAFRFAHNTLSASALQFIDSLVACQ